VKEIRIHGRGGQGNVTAGELLAVAAFKYSQAFPAFGSERMGSPVRAFVRVSDQKIRTRSQVLAPDYIIVQDPTLLGAENVLEGLKPDGMAIINSDQSPEELGLDTSAKVVTIPAFKIAREVIGRPVPNTVLMGTFAAATGLVSLEAIERSIRHRFRGEIADKNIEAARKAYQYVNGKASVKAN
jgi:pyruvate ferredoxin oxidoreductase gamma subunit